MIFRKSMVAPSGGTFPYPTIEMTKSPLSGVGGEVAHISIDYVAK